LGGGKGETFHKGRKKGKERGRGTSHDYREEEPFSESWPKGGEGRRGEGQLLPTSQEGGEEEGQSAPRLLRRFDRKRRGKEKGFSLFYRYAEGRKEKEKKKNVHYLDSAHFFPFQSYQRGEEREKKGGWGNTIL